MSNKKALLIGINYANLSCKLQGCINDIVNMRAMLIDAYGYSPANIMMLRDDDPRNLPTSANIIASLNQLASQSANVSEIVIHYSGHGSQVKDIDGDESSGMDSVVVPCDYPTAGFITDDMLFSIIQKIKCRTLLFFDSCNSGSVCDLQYSLQYTNGAFVRETSSRKTIPNNPNIVMISGCKDSQTSADAYDYSKAQSAGAFTATMLECLRNGQHNIDLFRLYNDICYCLRMWGFTQTPVLSFSTYTPQYVFSRGGTNTRDAKTLVLPSALMKTITGATTTKTASTMVSFAVKPISSISGLIK